MYIIHLTVLPDEHTGNPVDYPCRLLLSAQGVTVPAHRLRIVY